MRKILVFVISAGVAGCSGVTERIRGLAGVSTREVERSLGTASRAQFDANADWLFARSETILKEAGAYVYAKDPVKQLIAVYVSETDTTPVGIFFEEQSSGPTVVAVSSPSPSARERMAQKLFPGLEKSLRTKKVDVQLDALEEHRE